MFAIDAMISMNLADIAILNIKGAGYCYVISRNSKKRGQKLNAKYWFEEKRRNIIKHEFIITYKNG